MNAAESHAKGRRTDLLIEHVTALETQPGRPSANERLERLVGGYLARFLVGALAGGRRSRQFNGD